MALTILYNTINLQPDKFTGSVRCRYDSIDDVPKQGNTFTGDSIVTLPVFTEKWRVDDRVFSNLGTHNIVTINLTNKPDSPPTQQLLDILPHTYFKRAELKDALKNINGNTTDKDASFNTFSGIIVGWETGLLDWTDDTEIKVPGAVVKIKATEWKASFYDTTINAWNNLTGERVFDWNRVPSPIKLDAPNKYTGKKNFLLKQHTAEFKQSPKYNNLKYLHNFTFWVLPNESTNTKEWV